MTEIADAADQVTAAVLEAVRDECIGYTNRGRAGTSYRWWTSETTHRRLSPAERRALVCLLEAKRVVHRSGWQCHKGLVLLPTSRTL